MTISKGWWWTIEGPWSIGWYPELTLEKETLAHVLKRLQKVCRCRTCSEWVSPMVINKMLKKIVHLFNLFAHMDCPDEKLMNNLRNWVIRTKYLPHLRVSENGSTWSKIPDIWSNQRFFNAIDCRILLCIQHNGRHLMPDIKYAPPGTERPSFSYKMFEICCSFKSSMSLYGSYWKFWWSLSWGKDWQVNYLLTCPVEKNRFR